MKAISVRQPWAWLIVGGHKDIENRDWPTKFRGPILIHAGKAPDGEAMNDLRCYRHPVTKDSLPSIADCPFAGGREIYEMGGIVGEAEIVDCVTSSASPWFVGCFGFVLRNARPLPFRPLRGQLGIFEVK